MLFVLVCACGYNNGMIVEPPIKDTLYEGHNTIKPLFKGQVFTPLFYCCLCRKSVPLNENEGIYVRDIQSGQVRSVMGPQSYMIQANEELYEKQLTALVEDLLKYIFLSLSLS